MEWRTVNGQRKASNGDREAVVSATPTDDYGYHWLVYGLSGIAVASGYAQSIPAAQQAAEKHLEQKRGW